MNSPTDNNITNNSETDSAIELESSHWRLRLQPQSGLQTQSCQVQKNKLWHDVMPDCRSQGPSLGTVLSASNFHMLPYSNRIRDAQFTFKNQPINLVGAENHAIHGALRKLPWRVTEQSQTSVTAEYDTREEGNVNWPWPIQAAITYTLNAEQLVSKMSLTNRGKTTMPAGMGWHPYFSRTIAGGHPELTISVDGMYPDTDGDCLPISAAIPLSPEIDFNQTRKLNPEQRIDHCLSGFRSPATLRWPSAGIVLEMHASDNCTHLVLYNPDEPYFAVEPVTNANDAFNLAAKGIDAGVCELEPGATLNAEMRLILRQN